MTGMIYSRSYRTDRMAINERRRRNREIQQHIIILVLSVLLIITMAILFFGTKSHAEEAVSRSKSYVSVQVCEGDSLADLADRYYSSEFKDLDSMISEIRYINNMVSDQVTPGLFVIVPCYTGE